MAFARTLLPFLVFAAAVASRAQSTVPTLSQPLPAQSLATGGAAASIDLRDYFTVPGVTGQIAQFDTVLGKFNVELLANDAPASVANFLSYVSGGSYGTTLIHRSAALGATATSNRIVQGGGYDPGGASIVRKSPIALEYKLANARGTLAMARSSDLNSATSEWYFNVDDNTTVLGASNGGGYAVFARVLGTGMSVVDAIAAVPTYNVGGVFTNMPLRDIQPGQTQVMPANEILINAITAGPVFPVTGSETSLVTFSGSISADSIIRGFLVGSTLTLTPFAAGTTDITIDATDTNGNAASSTFTVTVAAAPVFTAQPASQAVAAGGSVTFNAAATASTTPAFQWQRNGSDVSGATGATLTINNAQPENAGLYTAVATSGAAGASDPAIFGVATTSKVIGAGSEIAHDIFVAANGNTFDQVLLSGAAATVTADASLNQITRTSFLDDNDDIVQVEFSGAGTISLVLDTPSGPMPPAKYNQDINYMKGHVGLVITGANETTNVAVFSVGRITAVNQALFKSDVTYDGMADVSFIAISTANGKFGGVRTANVNYSASKGLTGIYAPGVAFTGPVFVSNINASAAATPVLLLGSVSDARITGGNLLQANGQPVRVSGITQLNFTAGSTSHVASSLPAQPNRGLLLQGGDDVTGQIVVNPTTQ